MPYEIDKTLVISEKMINDATADGTLFIDVTNNLLIRRIKQAIGEDRYIGNTTATVACQMLHYGTHGRPLDPQPSVEQTYYLPSAVVTQLEAWEYQRRQAARTATPTTYTCPTMRFTLRFRLLPTLKA